MALVLGTNCGFVTTAPTSDPAGASAPVSPYATAIPATSPATAGKIVEIGWWLDSSTIEHNFEVGIYNNSVIDYPSSVVGSLYQTNSVGTTNGVWKRVTVDIDITGNTSYWIAVQAGTSSTLSYTNYASLGGGTGRRSKVASTLSNPFVSGAGWATSYRAFYAVWEAGEVTETNMKINIGDSFKDVDALKINIGDDWKAVTSVKQNIGDSWKDVF